MEVGDILLIHVHVFRTTTKNLHNHKISRFQDFKISSDNVRTTTKNLAAGLLSLG